MSETELLKKKLAREKKARIALEHMLEERTRELYVLNQITAGERDITRQYLQVAGTMLVALNSDYNITMVNPYACEVLEETEENLIGKNWLEEFIPPEELEELSNVFKSLMTDSMELYEYNENYIVLKSGEKKLVRWHNSILKDEAGKIVGFLGSGEDITEQRRVQKELKKSKEFSDLLFQVTPSAIFTVDLDHIVTSWNQTAEAVTGYSAAEVMGKTCEVFAESPCKEKCGLFAEDVPKPVSGKECTIRKKDGSLLHISKNVDHLKGPDGNIIGGIECFTDITAQKNYEAMTASLFDITNTALTVNSLDDLYPMIHKSLGTSIDVQNFYIALYHKETNMLTFPYIVDEQDAFLDPVSVSDSQSSSSRVVLTGKPFLRTPEVQKHLADTGELQQHGSQAKVWLGVPLKIGKEIVGVMVVQSYRDKNMFSEAHIPVMEFYADTIATAIARKKTEEQLALSLKDTATRQQEVEALLHSAELVLEYRDFESAAREIFEEAKKIIGATAGYIVLLAESGEEYEVLFLDSGELSCDVDPSLPMPIRGLRAEAYSTGRAVYDNNFTENEYVKYIPEGHVTLKNVLFSPLNIEGKTVGILGLANKPEDFNENDIKLAEAFGELAAISLKNAQANENLRISEEKFRNLFEYSNDAVMLFTDEGFFDCNKATLKMFGCASKEQFCTLNPAEVSPEFQPDGMKSHELAKSKIEDAFRNGVNSFTWLHKRIDGKEFPAEVLLSRLEIDNVPCLQAVVRDISDRVKRESEQMQREKLETVQDMIVTLNHRMNQPISVIISQASTLMSENEKTSQLHEDASIIYEEAKNLSELIKQISKLQKIDTTEYSKNSKMLNLDS